MRHLSFRSTALALAFLALAGLTACGKGSTSPTEPAPLTASFEAGSAGEALAGGGEPRSGLRPLGREAAGSGIAGQGPGGIGRAALESFGMVSPPAAARRPDSPGALPTAAEELGLVNDDARGKGKGKGRGRGNGGNGGDGAGALRLQIQPDVWNTNWQRSNGTVSAVIRGPGLRDVDRGSIVLVGTDGAAEPLTPVRIQANKNMIRAFFRQADAIETLDTPERGEVHEIKIEFSRGGEAQSLTDSIRVVGPGEGGGDDGGGDDGSVNVSLRFQPDVWNVSWRRARGTVTALLRGPDVGKIDRDSIVLVGTDPDAEPLEPQRVQRQGKQLRVFFRKSDAIRTLDTPARGETHELILRFTSGEEAGELKDEIRVVGPGET